MGAWMAVDRQAPFSLRFPEEHDLRLRAGERQSCGAVVFGERCGGGLQERPERVLVEFEQTWFLAVIRCHDLHCPCTFAPGEFEQRPGIDVHRAEGPRQLDPSASFRQQAVEPPAGEARGPWSFVECRAGPERDSTGRFEVEPVVPEDEAISGCRTQCSDRAPVKANLKRFRLLGHRRLLSCQSTRQDNLLFANNADRSFGQPLDCARLFPPSSVQLIGRRRSRVSC